MEQKDTITITFSKQMAAQSICSAWTNGGSGTQSDSTAEVLVSNDGTNNNTVTIPTWTGCPTNHVGSIDLGSKSYVTSTGGSHKTVSFTGSTIAYDGTARTLTVTLGAPQIGGERGTLGTVASSVLQMTLSASVTDLAGNATSPNTKSTGNVQQF
jgi:hypothetical protein